MAPTDSPSTGVDAERYGEDEMYVIVTNEPGADSVHGAFDTREEAEHWAHKHCVGCCWRVVKLSK